MLLLSSFFALNVQAAQVNFIGTLGAVPVDNGQGVYAGTPLGTVFSGFIDDVSFSGEISDGSTLTSFSCCIAAGGLSITNDEVLNADAANLLNQLTMSNQFSAGDTFDIVDIEGDQATANSGRIEVGLSYLLPATTFPNEDLGNYPFSPGDVLLSAFFILEEDANGQDIYDGIGLLQPVPLPGGILLFSSGLAIFTWLRARKNL